MLFTPLDSILSSGVRVRALRALADAPRSMSGREVARQARAGRSMTNQVLAELAQLGIVTVQETPVQHLYQLNTEHELVRHGLLPLFRAERARTTDVFAELRRIVEEDGRVLSAYVFGSAARGDDVPGSDLDLLVLARSAADAEAIHDVLSSHSPALHTRFGVVLSPVVLDVDSARRQMAGEHNFLHNVIREGRRIHGSAIEDLVHGGSRAA